MKSWTKILPFFLVAWLARRFCSRNTLGGFAVVEPYRGVWISASKLPPIKVSQLSPQPATPAIERNT